MASTETKHEICSPLMPRRNALRKTCAEIVNEVRQSLRVQSTHRPFTPRDGHRQLFGSASIRDNRPPSAFRLVRNATFQYRPHRRLQWSCQTRPSHNSK
uniref:Uncharacterized protein n=2 Tax=Haplochromini TaxID=319058 RepID=A0A3B4H7K0_9CICH